MSKLFFTETVGLPTSCICGVCQRLGLAGEVFWPVFIPVLACLALDGICFLSGIRNRRRTGGKGDKHAM